MKLRDLVNCINRLGHLDSEILIITKDPDGKLGGGPITSINIWTDGHATIHIQLLDGDPTNDDPVGRVASSGPLNKEAV